MNELDTEVKLLKRELEDQKKIHDRLDIAIEKLTDVSNSIHRMLAVHEEKLSKQEESIVDAEQQIEIRRSELSKQKWRHVLIGASIIAGFVINKILELDIL